MLIALYDRAMAGEIASGLFALGGTFVGGLASYAASAREARNHTADALRLRRNQMDDSRRQLYVEFVKQADLLSDSAREIATYENRDDVPDATRARYTADWEAFLGASATVAVAGPQGVVSANQALYSALVTICNQVDDWLNGTEWVQSDYDTNVRAKQSARTAFLTAAQDAVV